MQKNHNDRVKDYLGKMKGMSIEEIVNHGAQLINRKDDEVNYANPKQQAIIDSTRS